MAHLYVAYRFAVSRCGEKYTMSPMKSRMGLEVDLLALELWLYLSESRRFKQPRSFSATFRVHVSFAFRCLA